MMTEEMTKTVFGEDLAELLWARDMPATLAYVEGLVEGDNLDAALLIQRIEGTSTEHPGDAKMTALSDRLELTGRERREFAFAYTYEMRLPETPEVPEMTPEQEGNLRRAIRSADARNNALAVALQHPSPDPEAQQDIVDELQTLSEFAQLDVARLKREYGFPERSRPE